MVKIRKVVIPVAGKGTRFLPATKAQPKEMLTIVDKPIIQIIAEEALRCGLTEFIFITSPGKESIEKHFVKDAHLEDFLSSKNKHEELEIVRHISTMGNMTYVTQEEQLGLGHAVLCAESAVAGEPFLLMLGDLVFEEGSDSLETLLDTFTRLDRSVIAVEEVRLEDVGRYGIVNGPSIDYMPGDSWLINTLIEKPKVDHAPSNWGITGRYALKPEIFQHLKNIKRGHGGEFQITDALIHLAENGTLVACPSNGRHFDTGNKIDYIKANIEFALKHPEIGPEISEYLKNLKA
jgi:UTP--glucose-1-phosphate uridylyltransferase